MAAVWELSRHGGSAMLLLLAIADYADDNGLAWPGQTALAKKTRVDRRNLARIIDAVTASGELLALNRPRQRSNMYVVTPGLDGDGLLAALERALSMGATSTRGSDVLTLPTQVLEVASLGRHLEPVEIVGGVTEMLRGVIEMSRGVTRTPDPSLSVIDPSGRDDLWRKILLDLSGQMTKPMFAASFQGSEVIAADDGKWTAQIHHAHAKEWIDNRLRAMIDRTIERHAPGVTVEFVAKEG